MTQGKSLLNPYAAPFKPLSKVFSEISLEEECKTSEPCDSGDTESVVDTPEMAHQAGDTLQEETIDWDEESVMENFEEKINHLSSVFPDISRESLTEVFKFNYGDVNEAIYMLMDLEEPIDAAEISESSATDNNLQHIGDSSGSSEGTGAAETSESSVTVNSLQHIGDSSESSTSDSK